MRRFVAFLAVLTFLLISYSEGGSLRQQIWKGSVETISSLLVRKEAQ